jgi:hypothetical protein
VDIIKVGLVLKGYFQQEWEKNERLGDAATGSQIGTKDLGMVNDLIYF